MYYDVTQDEQDGAPDEGDEEPKKRRGRRRDGPKERVLHTRVPAVLEQELKQLAHNLRVPVSNVVRAILEDAVDAVDTVGDIAQGEILGFVDRLAKQREDLRTRVQREPEHTSEEPEEVEDAEIVESTCPDEAPEQLEGVYGYQPLKLASDTECSVCGAALPAGTEACRALFDEPGKRVFLGPSCKLMPG